MLSLAAFLNRAQRALRKPPIYVAQRLLTEMRHEIDRFTQPRFGRKFGVQELLSRTEARSVDELWERSLKGDFWIFDPNCMKPADYEAVCPGDTERIIAAAERSLRHEVDLLGSGTMGLGNHIDWHRDFKTGNRWHSGYFRGIDYINRDQPSDVKTVWELSRLQWLLPCGQAYVLTQDERYAAAARNVLEHWIGANPYAFSVNWCVTMEPALRIFSWAWLLRACGLSDAWAGQAFRTKLLCALYLHAIFTERFIERSDVNGNHFTADAAAMLLAGALFREGRDARRWKSTGLEHLEREIEVQTHPDGVNFEASSAYHRLVAELFLSGSMVAKACGSPVSAVYRQRLSAMARFTAAYTRPDGTAPLWGDHDDARTLPMGPQDVRDHRYLVGLIALHLEDSGLAQLCSGPVVEAAWWFGPASAECLPSGGHEAGSQAFPDGGVYIMRNARDHVFIDCGPVGLAGRGGHGHNDLLSFEAVLDGTALVTEGGCYVYTADFESRNRDRSTMSHNTPMVDGAEINRFPDPEFLWSLIPDAKHERLEFHATDTDARFVGRHDGYARLESGLLVERRIELEFKRHVLRVLDRFVGEGTHSFEVPLHLHENVAVTERKPGELFLIAAGREFTLIWSGADWSLEVGQGREAISYGRMRSIKRLLWRRTGLVADLEITIAPTKSLNDLE